jgi:hypothetical protein
VAAVQAAVGRPEPEQRAARLPAAQPAAVLRLVLLQQTPWQPAPWQETAPQRTALQMPELLQKPAPRAAASQRQEKAGSSGGQATSRRQTAPAA